MNKELSEILLGFKRTIVLMEKPEKISLFLLVIVVIFFGVWPAPLLNEMHSSVEHLVHQVMQSKV